MPLPFFYYIVGGAAIGIGIAAYEHREEIKEAYHDIKFGVEAAIAERQRRKMGHSASRTGSHRNPFLAPGESEYDDDDLYHTPSNSGRENEQESEDDLWESTKTLAAKDGQTSGIYNPKASFRRTRNRRTESPPAYTPTSDDVTTALSSTSSGEETPEDEASSPVSSRPPTKFLS